MNKETDNKSILQEEKNTLKKELKIAKKKIKKQKEKMAIREEQLREAIRKVEAYKTKLKESRKRKRKYKYELVRLKSALEEFGQAASFMASLVNNQE